MFFELQRVDLMPLLEHAIQANRGFGLPQLILLDVMMPVMDGPTTLKALHDLPEMGSIPAIFITAKVQPSEVARYRELGAVDVIPKPFNTLALSSRINEIWARINE